MEDGAQWAEREENIIRLALKHLEACKLKQCRKNFYSEYQSCYDVMCRGKKFKCIHCYV